jgi:hypothetical protein
MPDLRWADGPVHCTDLVDGTGKVFGYVGPVASGTRGYVVQSGSEWPPRPPAYADHPAMDTARAWVEAEVAVRAFRPVRIIRDAGDPR